LFCFLLFPHAVAASADIQAMHFIGPRVEEIVNHREVVAPGAAWLLPLTSVLASLLVFRHPPFLRLHADAAARSRHQSKRDRAEVTKYWPCLRDPAL